MHIKSLEYKKLIAQFRDYPRAGMQISALVLSKSNSIQIRSKVAIASMLVFPTLFNASNIFFLNN